MPYIRFVNPYGPSLDDVARFANSTSCSANKAASSFSPRFDVSEAKDSYRLTGELPGVDQKDISIEFTDANTLSIKGRTERNREESTRAAGQVEAAVEEAKADTAESETSTLHQASVEDDLEEITMSGANPDATPAETPAASEPEKQQVSEPPKPKSKYWVSERSVGNFARTFTFPPRSVDQENVKASLKDGILSVLVPKAPLPENRRINIE